MSVKRNPALVDVEFCGIVWDGRPAIEVSVRDYGTGLPAEVVHNALDAFVTTKTRGTGLGLAIVKRIVEAHGGSVSIGNVKSDGTGAIVSVILPKQRSGSLLR